LQRRFPIDDVLLRSRDIRDQVAKLREIAPKFRAGGHPDFWPNFINLGHDQTWQTLVAIGRATSEIRGQKKKYLNDSGKTEWPAASIADGRPQKPSFFFPLLPSNTGAIRRSDVKFHEFFWRGIFEIFREIFL